MTIRLRPATVDDLDGIHAVVVAADRIDHPTWVTPRADLEEVFELSHVDPALDTRVAVDPDDEIIGFAWAMVHPDTSAGIHGYLHGTVHPDRRRQGIGRELLAWSHDRTRELIAATGAEGPAAIFQYVDETNTDAVRLGERRGLRTERWFSSMQRDLSEPAAEVAAPDGVDLVPYTPERSEDVRLARNDAFRDHWGSLPSTVERWSKFVDGPFLRPDLSTLALRDGRVVAFCLASVNEEDWAALGAPNTYIDLIGVIRDERGRWLAPAVIARTLAAARDAGLEQAVLDVDTASKTGANTLYERLGFRATHRQQALVERF
ncbi:GNAT family N-acetyltransferase [Microbacterium aurantiacum]|uniref:GNAT family N-acetyltransferase n=1 Tax=Microbacterium aurantiacum TaxID=162393 RepID=UPI004036C4EA